MTTQTIVDIQHQKKKGIVTIDTLDKSKVAPSTINLKIISPILKHQVNFKIILMLKHKVNPI